MNCYALIPQVKTTEEIQTKGKHADPGCPLRKKYCQIKQRDFNRDVQFLPPEAFWSHNTGKVLKCLLTGSF